MSRASYSERIGAANSRSDAVNQEQLDGHDAGPQKGDRKRKCGTEIRGQFFFCAPMPRDPKCAVRTSRFAQRRTVDEHLATGEQDCAKESRRDGEETIGVRLGAEGSTLVTAQSFHRSASMRLEMNVDAEWWANLTAVTKAKESQDNQGWNLEKGMSPSRGFGTQGWTGQGG